MSTPVIVSQLQTMFQQLNASNCHSGLIEAVYAPNMVFEDSFHRIEGTDAFCDYCANLYQNLSYCRFNFERCISQNNEAMLTWTMDYAHQRLRGGKNISVEGASLLRFDDKITYHRDFFDGGKLLYEHVPVLGSVIRKLKSRLA